MGPTMGVGEMNILYETVSMHVWVLLVIVGWSFICGKYL